MSLLSVSRSSVSSVRESNTPDGNEVSQLSAKVLRMSVAGGNQGSGGGQGSGTAVVALGRDTVVDNHVSYAALNGNGVEEHQ